MYSPNIPRPGAVQLLSDELQRLVDDNSEDLDRLQNKQSTH